MTGNSRRNEAVARRLAISCLIWLGACAPVLAASFVEFETGQVRPLALSPDGTRLFAVNTPDNRLEIFSVDSEGLTHAGSVPVGMEPLAVAARNDDEVWVVNHLSDSISIVDVAAVPPVVVRTLLVGDEPRDIVFAGPGRNRAFITTAHRGQNSPVDPALTTPGVGRADVWVFDADNLGTSLGGTPLAGTPLTLFGDTPRALAASADGATVYAAVFHSGNRTTALTENSVPNGGESLGGLPGPRTNVDGLVQPEVGLIVRFDGADWVDELGRSWNSQVRFALPDRDVFVIDALANPPVQVSGNAGFYTGVGTILFNMTVNPVNGKVYVANTEAFNEVRFEGPGILAGQSVRGHLHESRITVLAGGSVQSRHLNKHVNYAVVPGPPSENAKSLAFPLDMAVTDDGDTLYVSAFGSSKVGVFDTADLEDDTFVPDTANQITVTGGGPSGLALDEPRDRLYVLTRFDNAIAIVDTITRSEIDKVALYNPEPPSIVNGRRFLYDAAFTSSHGDSACASCHVFGDFDSLGWDLGNPDDSLLTNPGPFVISFNNPPQLYRDFHPMKGPMTTQSLRGMANHGPMHWRGDRTGGNDAPSIQPDSGAFDEQAAFKKFNPAFEGLLGRSEQLTTAEMQAFTDFILQVTYPPNPIRALDNSLTTDEDAGRAFYFGPISDTIATCNGCHVLNPAAGFFGSDGRSTFEGETQHFKVAHLRNAYQKVGMFGISGIGPFLGAQVRGFGFLHDGSVDTVFTFLNAPVFQFPGGNSQRRQVERFILAFDSDLAPVVGQQITLTDANAAVVSDRIGRLVAQAAASECDVVVKGNVAGQQRGWYRRSDGKFRSDRSSEPLLTEAALRGLPATTGQPLTYTCVPPGSGVRVGVDRDEDTFFDRDELDLGTDPANPLSTPPPACGNNLLAVGEQCDDGNTSNGDGCSSNCTYELIPGNGYGVPFTDNRACLFEWSVVNPTNTPATDKRGRPNFIQTCVNNDPSCDFDLDPGNNTCEFRVVACLNNVDPNLPGCIQQGVASSLRVILPHTRIDPANNAVLTEALQSLRDPNTGETGLPLPVPSSRTGLCTDPFQIRVPLRGTTRLFPRRTMLMTLARSQDNSPRMSIDLARMTLICNP
jgi:cysteine-rich repeat protein